MGSWMRTVMMWLLLAALPVQSWAVATMLHCGPTHQRMGTTAGSHANASPVASQHDHGDHGVHHHDIGTEGEAPQPAQAEQDQTTPDQPPLSLGKFKCSACATCCIGVALPSAVVSFDASLSSGIAPSGMPQGDAVFLTAGPERPPRTFLA
jgi:hypothetical protein